MWLLGNVQAESRVLLRFVRHNTQSQSVRTLSVLAGHVPATAQQGFCSVNDWKRFSPPTKWGDSSIAVSRPSYQTRRHVSRHSRFQLEALPYSVSPEQALDKFREWAESDQGLRYLLRYDSIKIGAAYVPVWSFDLNLRFDPSGKNWKPPMFDVYQGSTVHVPGLSAYAGYMYRRSLINPVHSTSLVFLGDQTQRFGGWMLNDMVLKQSGATLSVVPDAWNATQGRSFQIVLKELQGIVDESWPSNEEGPAPKVQAEIVKARRVMMPTFVIDYSVFGLEYQAFVSGCDTAAPVAGCSHQVFGEFSMFQSPEFYQQSRNFLAWSSNVIRAEHVPFILRLFRPVFQVAWFGILRIWSSIPVLGMATGVLAGYRKILQPWMDARSANADWERQREHESRMEEEDIPYRNDFVDTGAARDFFYRYKDAILRRLSGQYDHEEGGFDWYKDWEKWAEAQWQQQSQSQQQQQQQNYYQQYQQQYQYRQRQSSSSSSSSSQGGKKKQEYHWDFDVNDPYSVLDIPRSASKKEVSDAFRRQMLKYHPDVQPNASGPQKERLVERSKIITDAYRKIKASM